MAKRRLERHILAFRRQFAPGEAARRHCAHVAMLADALFSATGHLHGLTKASRALLHAAAMFHDLRSPGRLALHLPANQRRIVAQAIRWQDNREDPGPLPRRAGADKPAVERAIAARLAAILRIAHALDFDKSQRVDILAVNDDGSAAEVVVSAGPSARANACLAAELADLWNRLALRPIRAVTPRAGEVAPAPLIAPDDQTRVAAGRLLGRLADQFVSRAYGLGYADDAEYVHEMRVATRRLRAAMQVFGPAGKGGLQRWRERLGELADTLGAARDSDVFGLFLRTYAASAPPAHQPFLRRLMAAEARNRRARKRETVELFASPRYSRLAGALGRSFGRAGLEGANGKARRPVRKTARKALRKGLRRVLAFSRRLADLDPARQHRLRIACKKLRYTAELFSDLYGPRIKDLISAMVRMQDALGEAHDAEVYAQRVDDFHARPGRPGRRDADAVQALHTHMEKVRRKSLARAAKAWGAFTAGPSVRRFEKLIDSPRRA